MHIFHSLLGFIPAAHAATLDTAGAGGPGVSEMWSEIKSVMCAGQVAPLCELGGNVLVVYFSLRIVSFIFELIGVVGVAMIIYAGIRIVTSEGKDEVVSEAKKIIMYAVVGIVLSLMATAVIDFVIQYFGLALA